MTRPAERPSPTLEIEDRAEVPALTRIVVALAVLVGVPAVELEAATAHARQPIAGNSGEVLTERIGLESDGWRLVGEWLAPVSSAPIAAALLLHRAAGSRDEYVELAQALAHRGVASLRLDLRAHGGSDNLGRFVEPFAENRPLLDGTYRDIDVALSWMKSRADVDASRVAVVAASYSGEAAAEGLRRGEERAAAYVMLSPGSFSDESITAVDRSGAAWLFVRTREESAVSRGFVDAVFEALAERSQSAELRVLPGEGHATRIFDGRPGIVEEIADWIAGRLAADAAHIPRSLPDSSSTPPGG